MDRLQGFAPPESPYRPRSTKLPRRQMLSWAFCPLGALPLLAMGMAF
jgi:hypothetical protein